MKNKTSILALASASILSARLCLAQTNQPADDWKTVSTVAPGQQFPQINSELRAKFRVKAPGATNVGVSLGRPFTSTKDDEGVLDRHHVPAGRGLSPLPNNRGWILRRRSQQQKLLWLQPLGTAASKSAFERRGLL